MYQVQLGSIIFPVAPSAISTKINNNNKTLTLINEGEINIIKDPKLTDVSFDVLLPNVRHPFAVYPDGFHRADYYLNALEEMKLGKAPVQFVIARAFPDGRRIFDNSVKVSLEDYTIKEDAGNQGFDFSVSVKLKHYKDFSVKTYAITEANKISVTQQRETVNSPSPKNTELTHKTQPNDTLWALARKYYGDGNKFNLIAKANGIANPNQIPVGLNLVIPID